MWWLQDTAIPELVPGRTYASPDGKRQETVIRITDDGMVEVNPRVWTSAASFAGWKLVTTDEYDGCRRRCVEEGWVWHDCPPTEQQ